MNKFALFCASLVVVCFFSDFARAQNSALTDVEQGWIEFAGQCDHGSLIRYKEKKEVFLDGRLVVELNGTWTDEATGRPLPEIDSVRAWKLVGNWERLCGE